MVDDFGIKDEGEVESGEEPKLDPQEPADVDEPYRLFGRIKRAYLVLMNRDVQERITVDPDARIRRQRAREEIRIRRFYAGVLLVAMVAQVWFADWFLVTYARAVNFEIHPSILVAFFSSVVAEVIGLVYVIARSVFPNPVPPDMKPPDD